ncbi:Rho-GTPase-activating protein 8 [Leucoagaricus sp. SymC.cos]|nr:Rho-GTPase-activating protein 8 [Leucoagaricus sp. SymC.cos]
MAILSLPLSFNNSFWSQDYRRGLDVLYRKLEQGVAENQEIIEFIRARSAAEAHLANSLGITTTSRKGTGFNADDGASLLLAFRGLQAESVAQGQAHRTVANELASLVADPFEEWAEGYEDRIRQNKSTVLDSWLKSYEQARSEVSKLKQQYLSKTRRADDADDDAKFAPVDNQPDKYTGSPHIRPVDGRAAPQRSGSVTERIAARFKELQKRSADALGAATPPDDSDISPIADDEKALPKVDKGKGKERATDFIPQTASPPPMSPFAPPNRESDQTTSPTSIKPPQPILLAGLSLSPTAVSQILTRAAAELPLRPVRFPLLGEYQDAFTGEEFVTWLKDNVEGFGGSLDRAEEAAKDLTEEENVLRRLGELGNQFESSDDAFYQFRPRAFNLDSKAETTPAKPEIVKRTGAFVNLVSKALVANASGEPAYVRARQEAEEADRAYRIAVRKLDRQRLGLEERIEETLKLLQRWESERLRAVKTVLLQFQGTLANLPKAINPSIERQATLIAAYQPESDLTALIERYRTGPFRPDPQVYESVAHEESDVVFGIDLRKWTEGGWFTLTSGAEKKDTIPPVITALLNALNDAYTKMENDGEKRKTWIYEVPLPAVHRLREALNAISPDQPIPAELLTKYDAPIIASTVRLWALELDPPLALYEGWDEFRKLYPSVGSSSAAAGEGQVVEEQRLQNIASALQRLPRVHLYVLDAIVKHLKMLMDNTSDEESNEVFIAKLALAVGRTILRPKQETQLSVQDRHPTLLFIDLLKNYETLLPPTIARKKRESERKVPIRKRTAPVDMRLSRSRISIGADAKQLLAAQQAAQNPKNVKSPPLPPLPSTQALQAARQPVLPPPPPPEVSEKFKAPGPPPPLNKPSPPPPPALQTPPPPPPVLHQSPASDLPPRPQFKEPPPENDDLPPRPNFKEPPPETDDAPPRPKFVDPPPEKEDESESEEGEDDDVPPPLPPTTSVVPPTPQKRLSATLGGRSSSASPSASSPIPPNEDIVLGTGKTTISRSGSGQNAGAGIRGPRLARGGRGGNVQSMVSNINRNSMSGNVSPPPPNSPKINRLSGSPVKRPDSVVGRTAAAFSRRTMTSDAEDDLVDRK